MRIRSNMRGDMPRVMMRHRSVMMSCRWGSCNVVVQIGSGCCRSRPVCRWRREETSSSRWRSYPCSSMYYSWEVDLGRLMMITRSSHHWRRRMHAEQVSRLIGSLVCCRISRSRLSCLSESLKVKLVGIPLTMNFCHDVLVVVVSKCSTQFVIIHVGFALPLTPSSSYFIWICQFKLSISSFPSNAAGVWRVRQQFKQELPQLYLSRSWEKAHKEHVKISRVTVFEGCLDMNCQKCLCMSLVLLFYAWQSWQLSQTRNEVKSALRTKWTRRGHKSLCCLISCEEKWRRSGSRWRTRRQLQNCLYCLDFRKNIRKT